MSERSRVASSTAVEVDRMTPYLWFLFVLLSTATLFDGFDSGMLGFAAPESRRCCFSTSRLAPLSERLSCRISIAMVSVARR